MSIATPSFARSQQQHHFQPANPRFINQNAARSQFPSGNGSHFSNSEEPFGNSRGDPHRLDNDRSMHSQPPLPTHQAPQQQALTSQLFQKHQLIPVFRVQSHRGANHFLR